MNTPRHLILVKHALPTLEAGVAPRHWRLGPEGQAQSLRLAQRLKERLPFRLACSHEPKAEATAHIIGAELGLAVSVHAGLEELDRPALPILSAPEHAQLNAPIFSDLARRVVGNESGAEALERFRSGLSTALSSAPASEPLVVVTHGTVITLFVAANNSLDAFAFWQRLACSSFVVLALPNYELVEVVDSRKR